MKDERNSTMNTTKNEVNKEVKTNPTINKKTLVKKKREAATTCSNNVDSNCLANVDSK